MTALRILNDAGLQRFRDFLAAARLDPSMPPPFVLLEDGLYSDPFTSAIELERRDFSNAFELGVHLGEVLAGCEAREISRNHRLWSWLALFYFDSIAPPGSSGQRKLLEDAVYVLEPTFTFRRYYRHAVRTPWLAVRLHGEFAKILLLTSGRGTRTEFAEQIGAYADLFGCANVVAAAYEMWFDREAQKPRRGAGGKGPGSPRRLAAVVRQLQLTYDLDDCTLADFIRLLPSEFGPWIRSR